MEREILSQRIGQRLRELRQRRNLSLDALAQRTDVSKPMLAQIERGASNPTVATLWKIAAGLNVPFTTFLGPLSAPARVTTAADQMAVLEDEGRYQVYSTCTSSDGRVELYRLRLLPGAHRLAEAHPPGIVENITVFSGQMDVTVDLQAYRLAAGDTLQFPGDVTHDYHNPGPEVCEAHLALFYPV
ncbi:DNA-binding protein [Alicyclobacillus contaminans]|uniref:helix-turn-helix domain-containing protein n=1 Tax=Alicyclobacillus contaminans TaxID=392016 RepID=UPI00040CE7D5|nr:XRE family transcriptional regulator [Alicyclobacillus contaminans]GMA51567.1 DNA-binding protein [Alicyclobacillus contaminans]